MSRYFRSNSRRKLKGLTSKEQLNNILLDFPNAKIVETKWDGFEIILTLQPTPISERYDVLISYEKNRWVKVFVINKQLKIAPNRKKLPHVYDSLKQQLCLYSPSKGEWNGYKSIITTIIPWASEWLYYYELWLPEGKWYGGGHNEYPNEDNSKILSDD